MGYRHTVTAPGRSLTDRIGAALQRRRDCIRVLISTSEYRQSILWFQHATSDAPKEGVLSSHLSRVKP